MDLVSTYDELPYTARSFEATHPDRLAVVATLHGLRPAPVGRCRVLELGCGCGGNLVPMAANLPDSRFLGIDLSPRQIDAGRETLQSLGLANIELAVRDILQFPADAGLFDYIICHGVYSWVPADVQARILSLCKRHLGENGLALVSYNALPGWRMFGIVRDILRFGARGEDRPARQVERGLEFLKFVADLAPPDALYAQRLQQSAESLSKEPPTYVYHEYLEANNEALYFEEFIRRAAADGLRYVDDTQLPFAPVKLKPQALHVIERFSDDVVHYEQCLDFLLNRTFRYSLLCHSERTPTPQPRGEAIAVMSVASMFEVLGDEGNPAEDGRPPAGSGRRRYRMAEGVVATIEDRCLNAALLILHEAAPAAVPFDRLAQDVATALGDSPPSLPQGKTVPVHLMEALLACAQTRLVELHAYRPPLASRPGPRPLACPAARVQAPHAEYVTNLWHQMVYLDGMEKAVLARLDGTRDRKQLGDEIGELVRAGALAAPEGLSSDAPDFSARLAGVLDRVLQDLARHAFLIEGLSERR